MKSALNNNSFLAYFSMKIGHTGLLCASIQILILRKDFPTPPFFPVVLEAGKLKYKWLLF